MGFAYSLNKGNHVACGKFIARMDADDVSVNSRLEKQVAFLDQHTEIDVVSSWSGQFDTDPNDLLFVLKWPASHGELSRLARFRTPFSHPASMYRRSAVLAVGGYVGWNGLEDWHLWSRLIQNGYRIACIQEVLYKFRRDGDFVGRRRGLLYAKAHISLQLEFLRTGFVSYFEFIRNVLLRSTTCFLPPATMQYVRRKLNL